MAQILTIKRIYISCPSSCIFLLSYVTYNQCYIQFLKKFILVLFYDTVREEMKTIIWCTSFFFALMQLHIYFVLIHQSKYHFGKKTLFTYASYQVIMLCSQVNYTINKYDPKIYNFCAENVLVLWWKDRLTKPKINILNCVRSVTIDYWQINE